MATRYGQATFIGGMATVLAVISILVAAFAVGASFTAPQSGSSHVDQAGSSDPQALPTPQTGDSSTQVTRGTGEAPPASQMPAGRQAPAAEGENPAEVPPPATDVTPEGNTGSTQAD